MESVYPEYSFYIDVPELSYEPSFVERERNESFHSKFDKRARLEPF